MVKFKRFQRVCLLVFGVGFFGFVSVPITVSAQEDIKVDQSVTARHYEEVADNYLRFLNTKNLEGILSLYAENGTVEDPVGSNVIEGMAALRKFYTGAVGYDLKLTRTGPVRVAGTEAAFPFQLVMKVEGKQMKTDIIDVFRFDKEGKIVSMRAFWGPSNRSPWEE